MDEVKLKEGDMLRYKRHRIDYEERVVIVDRINEKYAYTRLYDNESYKSGGIFRRIPDVKGRYGMRGNCKVKAQLKDR